MRSPKIGGGGQLGGLINHLAEREAFTYLLTWVPPFLLSFLGSVMKTSSWLFGQNRKEGYFGRWISRKMGSFKSLEHFTCDPVFLHLVVLLYTQYFYVFHPVFLHLRPSISLALALRQGVSCRYEAAMLSAVEAVCLPTNLASTLAHLVNTPSPSISIWPNVRKPANSTAY